MHNPIIDKIRKLLALANDKGASEDEAATAMRMAMGLMAKHGIEEEQVATAETRRKLFRKALHKRFHEHQIILAGAAATLFGCRVLSYVGKLDKKISGIEFVGRPDNVEASEAVLMYLTRQVDELYKSHLPLPIKIRREFRRSFKEACAIRVYHRALDVIKHAQAQGISGQNALVVQGYFENLFKEADEEIGKVDTRKSRFKTGIGSSAGYAAGDRVKLRDEVEAK